MQTARILIVDDSGLDARLERLVLEAEGFSVLAANNGEQAVELVKSYRPDLILLLLPLRNEDGIELMHQLKSLPLPNEARMIVLTDGVTPAHWEEAQAAGCRGFIRQPVDRGTFAGLIAKYLAGEKPAAAELTHNFLTEGLEQCAGVLKQISSGEADALDNLRVIARRWVTLSGNLARPELSEIAGKIDRLLNQPEPPPPSVIERELERALERFREAAGVRLRLPLGVVTGLAGVRIGLIDSTQEQAQRIRTSLREAGIHGYVYQAASGCLPQPAGFDALVILETDPAPHVVSDALQYGVPLIVVASRPLLQSLSRLPIHSADFVTFPWDAEEILIRVYRLLAVPRTSVPEPGSGKAPGRKPRILIVDDDPSVISIVTAALQHAQMECDSAGSGPEGLEKVHRSAPDAIVLDVNMFGMDGFDVLMALRRNPATANIPVLLLTARRQESDVARGFGYGADDYLIKPFNPFELSIRVERIISSQSTHAAPHATMTT